MCRHTLAFAFPGNKRLSVREVFDAFAARRAIPVDLIGFTYEKVPGTNRLNLVQTTDRSVVQAELVPLEPGAPRRKYRSPRGVEAGLTKLGFHGKVAQFDSTQNVSPHYGGFWFRQLEDDSWVIEYELDASTCPACNPTAINSAAA